MSDEERQIVVFSDTRPALANMVRNRLAEAGIEAFVENETLGQAAGDLPGGAITPRVVVAEIDAAAAREIVAEFRRESPTALTISHRGREHRPAAPRARDAGRRAAAAARDRDLPRVRASADHDLPLLPNHERDVSGGRSTGLGHRRRAGAGHLPDVRRAIRADLLSPLRLVRPRFWQRARDRAPETVEFLNDRVTVAVMGLGLVLFAILAYFSRLLK